MENSISNIYKFKNPLKRPKCVLLCGTKLYVTPKQPFWSLWGVYSHKLFPTLNQKNEFADNK